MATSSPIYVNWRQKPFSIGLGCVISPGANLVYKVQHTFDDLQDSTVTPTWLDHATISSAVSNTDGNYAFPVRAVRLNVTSYTSGNVTLTIVQGE